MSATLYHCCALFLHIKRRLEGVTFVLLTSIGHQLSRKVSPFIPEVTGLSHSKHVKVAKTCQNS